MVDKFYNDFIIESSLPLEELGKRLSEKVFCGIPFVDSDGWMEEIPALLLTEKFMGMVVVLGGYHTNYQLWIKTYFDRKWFDYERIDHGFGNIRHSINLEKYFSDVVRGAFHDDDEVDIYHYEEPWILKNEIELLGKYYYHDDHSSKM